MYNKSYQDNIQVHTGVKKHDQKKGLQRQPFAYRNLDYVDSITWNIHLFWRLIGSKKTRHGASGKIKRVFLKLVNYYVYFGFFFSNSKYVKGTDMMSFHRVLHSKRLSDNDYSLSHLFFLSEGIMYQDGPSFERKISFPFTLLKQEGTRYISEYTVPQEWWTQARTYQSEWGRNKLVLLYYKRKYRAHDAWYGSSATMVDAKWCIDGQQLIHFYTYFYFLWQDFIQNFCYFVYPNMHVFGKKYKVQRRWAVFKVRNYYGQYKWFLFYIGQFLNVDFKLLDYFKRGVVQWTKYASFPQKWFFMLNTIISFRWYQMEAVRNDSLKRSQFLWKENLFSCLDSCLSISPSLNSTHRELHPMRSYFSWESEALWLTGDMKALIGIWKMCISFREKLFQLRGSYWLHTKVFAQFRFKGGSNSKLAGKLKARKLFFSKKIPNYTSGVQKAISRASYSRFKWKKDLFWNLKSRVILKKRLFDFIKQIRHDKEDLKQVVYSYFCNHYIHVKNINNTFLMHKSSLLRSYQQKQLRINKTDILPLSLSFGKRGHWASKLLGSTCVSLYKNGLKFPLLAGLCNQVKIGSLRKWDTLFNLSFAGLYLQKFSSLPIENNVVKNNILPSVYSSLLGRLCGWFLRIKRKELEFHKYTNFKLFQKGYHDGWAWLLICVWLWRYVIAFLSKKVARKMVFRLWSRFTYRKGVNRGASKKNKSWKVRRFLKKHTFFNFLMFSFRRSHGSLKKGLLLQNFFKATKWIWTMAKSRLVFNLKQQFQLPFFRVKENHLKEYALKRISLSVDFFSKKLFLYNRFLRRKFKNKKSKKKIKKWIRFRKKARSRLKYTYGLRTYNTEYDSIYRKFNVFVVSIFKWFNVLSGVYSYRKVIERFSRLNCAYYLFHFLGVCQELLNRQKVSFDHSLLIKSSFYHTSYQQRNDVVWKNQTGLGGEKWLLSQLAHGQWQGSSYFFNNKLPFSLKRFYPVSSRARESFWVHTKSQPNLSVEKHIGFRHFFFGLCKAFGCSTNMVFSGKELLLYRNKEYRSILDAYPDMQYAGNIKFFQKWRSFSNNFKSLHTYYSNNNVAMITEGNTLLPKNLKIEACSSNPQLILEKVASVYNVELGQYKLNVATLFSKAYKSFELSTAPWAYTELYRVGLFYKTFLVLAKTCYNSISEYVKYNRINVVKSFLGSFSAFTFQSLYNWNNILEKEANTITSQGLKYPKSKKISLLSKQLNQSSFFFFK